MEEFKCIMNNDTYVMDKSLVQSLSENNSLIMISINISVWYLSLLSFYISI